MAERNQWDFQEDLTGSFSELRDMPDSAFPPADEEEE